MTTGKDSLKERERKLGEAREVTEGIPRDGFSDATGEYPNRDFFFGNSINKAAKGEKINTLFAGGGDYGVPIDLNEQRASQYPHNQVQETPSGHVMEIDDTPGGERILIKHRSGAGIELRADGSVLFSSVNKKVEVTGGDHTVIVEGEGNLIYKGDLTVKVTGDYNLEVGGNINVTSAGDKTDTIQGSHTKTVEKNQNYVIKGSRGSQVVGANTDTILGNNDLFVKGNQRNFVQGNVDLTSGNKLITTAANEWVATSQTTNISGMNISVMGTVGTIGGAMIDHYGKLYSGPPEGLGNGGTTFMGTLVGRAAEAILADFSNVSAYAQTSGNRLGGDAYQPIPSIPKPPVFPFVPVPATAPMPNPIIVAAHLSTGTYAIRNVQIDTDIDDPDSLISKILKTDDYDNLFSFDPSIHEIRSKLRDKANLDNTKLTGALIAKGLLSDKFSNTSSFKLGRTANRKPTLRYGKTPLGNNPADERSKRFRPE